MVVSMAETAKEAGVRVVGGDTKVVGHGEADKLFINTTGLGEIPPGRNSPPWVLPGPSCWKRHFPFSGWASSRRPHLGAACFQPPGNSSLRRPGSAFSPESPFLSPSWVSIFSETVCGIFWIPIRPTRRDNKWTITILDAGCWLLDTGYWMLVAGY